MDLDEELFSALDDAYTPVPSGSGLRPAGERLLDLVFIMDCTGSMGSYIASATKNCEVIVENILQSERLSYPDSLRIGLIAYRDYPPQDSSYITKSFPFTSDVSKLKSDLGGLYASGGGDGPEGVTAAFKETLDLDWRPNAAKMAVLIADAPPHGIGEYGDGFPNGSPDGLDPLQLARQMASHGITLFVAAAEPALSGYQYANDFFKACTIISSGVLVPLTNAALLSHVIVGSALEQMDMERLIEEVGLAVSERLHGGDDVDAVARALHEQLLLRGESTKHLVVESIYRDSAESRHNVEIFTNAETVLTAKPLLKKVIGSRFTEKYLSTRYSSSSYGRSSSYPTIPPRSSAPSAPTPPSSPPRKVVSEFKPFAASSNLSMAETPLSSTPLANAAQAEDELAQSVELRFGQISLEQVKRITIASAWRSAPPRA